MEAGVEGDEQGRRRDIAVERLQQQAAGKDDEAGGDEPELVQMPLRRPDQQPDQALECHGYGQQQQQCRQVEHRAGFYPIRSEEHTSELQSLMRTSYAVFCLKKKNHYMNHTYDQKTMRQQE